MQIRCELNIMHTNSTPACIGAVFPETRLWFCWWVAWWPYNDRQCIMLGNLLGTTWWHWNKYRVILLFSLLQYPRLRTSPQNFVQFSDGLQLAYYIKYIYLYTDLHRCSCFFFFCRFPRHVLIFHSVSVIVWLELILLSFPPSCHLL